MFHVCCLVEAHEQLDEQNFLGVVAQLYYVAPKDISFNVDIHHFHDFTIDTVSLRFPCF